MKYTCFRCGDEFNRKGNYLRHLNRKNICDTILNSIDLEENLKMNNIKLIKNKNKILDEIIDTINSNICQHTNAIKCQHKLSCKYCNKEFKYRQSKSRHEKTCKEKDSKNKMEKMEEKIIELENKIKNMKSDGKNITNNITNNNVIIVNNYITPNIDFLEEKYIKKMILGKHYSLRLSRIANKVFFNEKHPENFSIIIKDEKSGKGEVYYNDLIVKPINEIVKHTYEECQDIDYTLADEYGDDKDMIRTTKDYEKYINSKKYEDNINKQLKFTVINGSRRIKDSFKDVHKTLKLHKKHTKKKKKPNEDV